MAELRTRLRIAADHPCLPGHFPGNPLVPGVVLLDEVRAFAQSALAPGALRALPMVKFVAPVRPEQDFDVILAPGADGRIAFRVEVDGAVAVQGSLQFDPR